MHLQKLLTLVLVIKIMIVPIYEFYFEDRNTPNNTLTKLKHDVDGWKEYGVTFGRETEISNIVKSYTNQWIFFGSDADYIKTKFYTYGVNAKVRLIVKKLTNFLQKKYEIDYAGYFDFSQIEISGSVSIPLNEGGLFRLIENQWSKDIEITMNNKLINFDGVKLNEDCMLKNLGAFSTSGTSGYSSRSFIIGLQFLNQEKKYDIFQECPYKHVTDVLNAYTLENAFMVLKTGFLETFRLSYNLDFNISLQKASVIGNHAYRFYVDVVEFDYNAISGGGLNDGSALRKFEIYNINPDWIDSAYDNQSTNLVYSFKKRGVISINPNGTNGKVYFLRVQLSTLYLDMGSLTVTNFNPNHIALYCESSFYMNKNRNIQCVRVNHVFQELINRINNNRYKVEIDFTELNKFVANDLINRYDVLTNGNGLRGNPNILTEDQLETLALVGLHYENMFEFSWAKLTTNLEQFLKFLYICYGLKISLNYDIARDKYFVSLNHENNCFVNAKIENFKEVNKCHIKPVRELFYTQIKVGYSTKDDSINGKEEYNGTLEFSTMITEMEENILDLVSPYSASVFDIETFMYNNYQNFSDSADKDTEIFVISTKKHPTAGLGYFTVRREIPVTSGLAFPETAWNVDLTPRRILETHSNLLNSCFAFHVGEKLIIATAKRNKSLDAGSIVECDPFVITKNRLFYPLKAEISYPATARLISKIEQNRNGYISFEYGGKKIKGYLYTTSAVTINPMNEKESEFVLLCHGDELPKI